MIEKPTINVDGLKVSITIIEQALEAMAQGRPILLVGAAGAGKSMLARKLGAVRGGPFRAPHHTVSKVGMTGNKRNPKGECALADKGTLFLDELPEFRRDVLFDAVRVAYREGELVHHDRRDPPASPRESTDFWLIGAMNYCPCGWLGSKTRRCVCGGPMLERYAQRIQDFKDELGFEEIHISRPDCSQPCIMAPGEIPED